MKTIQTPLPLLISYTQRMPCVWDVLEALRTDPEAKLLWKPPCYLPCAAARAVLEDTRYGGLNRIDSAAKCAELTGLFIWRKDKVIYRFDHDLAVALAAQAEAMSFNSVLPIDLMMHLPHDCIYLQTDFVKGVDGFFVWIEHDAPRDEYELRMQIVSNDFLRTIPLYLHLSEPTLGECVQASVDEAVYQRSRIVAIDLTAEERNVLARREASAGGNMEDALKQSAAHDHQLLQMFAIQLLLYVLADNADKQLDEQQAKIFRPRKSGSKIKDKHSEIQIENVGVRIGAALRRSSGSIPTPSKKSEPTGIKRRPHMRRGHWHHYWTGARGSADRRLKLNWVAPTMIHPEEGDADEVVVRPVK